jgi:UDP-3-O-acyl-N-acetylglucosamine deacetylase
MIIPHVANVNASTKLAQHVVCTIEHINIAIKALKMPPYIEVQKLQG